VGARYLTVESSTGKGFKGLMISFRHGRRIAPGIRNSEFGIRNSELPPDHPSTQRRGAAETQRNFSVSLCAARPRGRRTATGLLGRETVSIVNSRADFPAQRPALLERRPRQFSSSFNTWEWPTPSPLFEKGERQNRRAPSASAGEKAGGDGCSHPEASGLSPATGDSDRLSFCLQEAEAPYRVSHSTSAPLRLCVGGCRGGSAFFRAGGICVICVICGQTGRAGGRERLKRE
jgi:hypothetical protein